VLNSALAELTDGGKILIKGNYEHALPITVEYDKTHIAGEGMFKTSIKLAVGADDLSGGGDLIYLQGMDSCSISDIELDGNKSNQTYVDNGASSIARSEGIMAYDTTGVYGYTNYLTIERVYVHDFAALGIRALRSIGTRVQNSLVVDNGWGDINLSGYTLKCIVENNTTGGSGNGSIETMGDSNTISNNIIMPMNGVNGSSNGRIGIENERSFVMTRRGDGNIITNNTIIGGGITRVGIKSMINRNTISNNTISNLTPTGVYNSTGIWMQGDSGSVVQNNSVFGDSYYGIIMDTTVNATVSGNTLKDLRVKGIIARFASTGNLIKDNYCETASYQTMLDLYRFRDLWANPTFGQNRILFLERTPLSTENTNRLRTFSCDIAQALSQVANMHEPVPDKVSGSLFCNLLAHAHRIFLQ